MVIMSTLVLHLKTAESFSETKIRKEQILCSIGNDLD